MTGSRLFERVCGNIRAARDARLPITLAITPNRFMEEDAIRLIDTAQELGVPYAINSELFEPRPETGRSGQKIGASIDTYIRMLKRQREYMEDAELSQILLVNESELPTLGSGSGERRGIRCAAGRSMFEIDWRGRMYGCSSLRSLYAEPMDGSEVPEGAFIQAWKLINERVNNVLIPAECGDCAYSDICITCPVAHEQNGSSAHCNREYCERVKRMVMEGLVSLREGGV